METSEEISNATKSDASNSTENVGLDSLNDHCLLQLFNYLPLKDARNLAETSKRFKLLFMMFRYRKFLFEFHCDMFTKICKNGKRVIENILLEYGPNLRSWSLTVDGSDSGVEILKTISAFSKNLTRLELTGLPDAFGDCGEALGCFENVEALIFIDCGVVPLTFLKRFRNLKHLKFEGRSGTTIKDLQIVFENNPNIESYSIRDLHYLSVDGGVDLLDFDRTDIARFGSELNLLKCGPKFHMLDLGSLHYDCLKMDDMLLLAATNLTKLKLDCLTKNATVFLTELAKRNTLKELDICGLAGVVNQELCNVIQSFRKLELLKFGTSAELGPPFVWPPNLRRLCLTSPVTGPIFLRIVRQLKYLTHLQLTTIPNSEVCFRALYETFMENGTRIIRRPNLHIFYDWFTRPRETPSQAFFDYKSATIYRVFGDDQPYPRDDHFGFATNMKSCRRYEQIDRDGTENGLRCEYAKCYRHINNRNNFRLFPQSGQTLYPLYNGEIEDFIKIDFSIPKCSKRKCFSY